MFCPAVPDEALPCSPKPLAEDEAKSEACRRISSSKEYKIPAVCRDFFIINI